MNEIKILDTIATLQSISSERLALVEPKYKFIEGLPSGLLGTIVEIRKISEASQYLVNFSDLQGREYAMVTLKGDELFVLKYELKVS